jgi:streptomycin 6-kinase
MEAWYRTLEKHVLNTFGQPGQLWLHALQSRVDRLAKKWNITHIKPLDFPSCHYVAFCDLAPNRPVVLKISLDEQHIKHEYTIHEHFNGMGVVRILAVDWDDGAVLLERAVPGDVLRAMDRNEAMEIYANTIKQWQQCTHNHSGSYRHCGEWLDAMDGMDEKGIEKRLVDFARELQTLLCHEKMEEKICHGDLHLGNIISHRNDYVAIDPKGVVGELAFEVSAFELLTEQEMQELEGVTLQTQLHQRVQRLSSLTGCDEKRLLAWCYIRALIGLISTGLPNSSKESVQHWQRALILDGLYQLQRREKS